MAVLRLRRGRWLKQVAVAAHRLLVRMLLVAPLVEMAVMEPRHLFPVRLLLMQAGVVALSLLPVRSEQVVQVAVEMPLMEQAQVEPLILAAAGAVATRAAAQAAPVSSSSNTTSALPQSSPSSHRRTGLHLRVR
jgi:hypothetical protein